MELFEVNGAKISLKPSPDWQWAGGFNGEITIKAEKKDFTISGNKGFAEILLKPDIIANHIQLLYKLYTTSTHTIPGYVVYAIIEVTESTLCDFVFYEDQKVALKKTQGNFSIIVIPAQTSSIPPTPDPIVTKTGTWKFVDAPQSIAGVDKKQETNNEPKQSNNQQDELNNQQDELELLEERVNQRILTNEKFVPYRREDLKAILDKAKELKLSDEELEDFIYVGSRKEKAISKDELIKQMEFWQQVKEGKITPGRFQDKQELENFTNYLKEGLKKTGFPIDNVKIQGSSLRRINPGDVDIAVFVNETEFDKLLIARYNNKIKRNESKISLDQNTTHDNLMKLAKEIQDDQNNMFNANARTFANAFNNGIISSKTDISKELKTLAKATATEYKHLNIESISVLLPGRAFDLKPSLKL